MAFLSSGSATIDEQMGLRRADEAFYKCMGENIYGSIRSCLHPDDFHLFQEAFDALKAEKTTKNFTTVRKLNPDGGFEWLLIELTRESFQIDGRPLFHLNLSPLMSENTNTSKLKQITEEYEALFNLLGNTFLIYDMQTGILDIFSNCNGQKLSLFHDSLKKWEEIFLQKTDPQYHNELHVLCNEIAVGNRSFQHYLMTNAFTKDGSMELCTFKCQSVISGQSLGRVLGCIIASDSNQQNAAIDISGNMDTALPILNKKAITEYARSCFYNCTGKVYLIILDLDDFKVINDTYGHMFGDEVLLKTANIIKDAIGNTGIVGRIGGDEMMIILNRIESHAELRNMLRSIRTGIEWAYKDTNEDLHVTCSIGIAAYPDHGSTYDEIFHLADRMLYIAKNKGKNRYVIYTPEIHDPAVSSEKQDNKAEKFEMLRNNKAGVMQRLIHEFLLRKIIPYAEAFNEIGYCFELDEILMTYEDMKLCSLWDHDGYIDDFQNRSYLTMEQGFLDSFDKNNIFAVNGIFNLEEKTPVLCSVLDARGIESALFYKMTRNGTMFGYILFAKKNRRQMWSEYDKTLLATIGKIIELSFTC